MLDDANIMPFLSLMSKYAQELPGNQGKCDSFLKWTISIQLPCSKHNPKIQMLGLSNFAQGKNGKKKAYCQAKWEVILAAKRPFPFENWWKFRIFAMVSWMLWSKVAAPGWKP
jgi:hypothetical protein